MPFDRLPGRIAAIPQLYHIVQVPPRPIVPWGEMITGAVDKVAQGAMALTPQARAKHGLEMAQLGLQREMLPQQAAVERAKLNYETKLYNNFAGGGMAGGHFHMTTNGPVPFTALEEATLTGKEQSNRNAAADRSPPGTGFETYDAGHNAAVGVALPKNPVTSADQQKPLYPYDPNDPNNYPTSD